MSLYELLYGIITRVMPIRYGGTGKATASAAFAALAEDTGWVNITPSKGTWDYFRVRRVGDIVYIRAHASSFAWGGATGDLIATLPTKYRPPFSNLYSLQTSGARRTTKICVTTGGSFVCDYVWNADGTAYTSAGWLAISLQYMV